MQKIVKITQDDAVVGNTEDSSFKRIPLSNCYEGMAVDDIVDLFQDGNECFIMKKESLASQQSGSGFSGVLSDINVESVANQGRKLLSQFKTILAKNEDTDKDKGVDKIQVDNSSAISEKLDLSLFVKHAGNFVSQFREDLKKKNTWLGAAVFLGILFAASFLISVVLKDIISNMIDSYIGGFIDVGKISINPMIILGEVMFAGLRMSANLFGESMSGAFEFPIIIMSIPLILAGIFSVKLFHNSKSKNISNPLLLRSVMNSVLAAFLVLLLVSLIYSQNIGFIKIQLDVFPMIFKGLLITVILTVALISGLKLSGNSPTKIVVNHTLRHILNVQVMGLLMALIIVLKEGFKEVFILIGNIAVWSSYVILGGQVSGTMSGNTTQNLLETYIPGITNWIWVVVIFVIVTVVIDLDDLKANLPKMPDWKISLIYASVFTLIAIFIASSANVAIKQGSSQMGFIGASVGSSIVIFLLLFGAGFARLAYQDKIPGLAKFRKFWLTITRAKV